MVLRKIAKILSFAVAGVLGSILVLMLVVTIALDRAPHYDAEIKDWVHARSGYHIAFAHVSPAFRWYGPELYFDQLELRSKDDRRVLARAAGARVGADIWQLLRSGTLVAGRIELDAPHILIVRSGPDSFALASEIEIGGAHSSMPQLRLAQLPAGTLAIRHGVVTIQNWNPASPQVVLQDVTLSLRRGEDGATLMADARLPAALGGSVRIRGLAHGDGSLDTLQWTARVDAQQLSFGGWRELLPQYLSRLGAGAGGFDLDVRGRGRTLADAELNFRAENMVMQLNDEPAVRFDQVTAALSMRHRGDRWTLSGRRVRTLRAGHRDPDSEFDVNWRDGADGLLELRARASYVRAETLLPLAGFLPQKDLRERLQEVAPSGEWMDTQIDLARAAASDPWRFNLKARFRGVGFAPSGRAPGLRGLNGTLAGNESGGHLDLDTQQGVFTWPSEITQPVELQGFKTTLYWKRDSDELLVATPSIQIKNRDATLLGRMAWHQPSGDGGSPVLVLVGSVDNGNVANTHVYLPRLLIPPVALTWLNRALPAGHLSHADVIIDGPIRHFPFRDGTGVFSARMHMDSVALDYREGWPRMENLSGVAEFRNEGLKLQLQSGRIGSLALDGGTARFADFKTAELQIHLSASGDAADVLDYLRATPLDAMAEHSFSAVEAKGAMQADVDLFLPFKQFDQRHTLVQLHLQGVTLQRSGSSVAATELTGDAEVEGAQVSRADVHGKLLGGPFQMLARAPRNRPVTRTTLVFNGLFTGDALHAALALPTTISITGSTDWHGVFKMTPEPARERSLRLSGSLAGLELNLPEPLAKPAGRPLPSSVEIQWPVSGGPQLRLAVGSVLRGLVSLDVDANGPTLGRAAVAFGSGFSSAAEPLAFSDSQRVTTGGTIDHLDLTGWLKLYTPGGYARPITDFLRTAKFDVAQIDYLGLSFLDVSVALDVSDLGWRVEVGGPNVVGRITLPSAADSSEPWKLEFQRLKFVDGPGLEGPGVDGMTQHTQQGAALVAATPHGIPSIDFHAADMIWSDRQLGDVKATLRRVDDGISLNELTLTTPNLAARATGEWRGKDAGLGRMQGTLTSSDVGGALKDLGYDAVIEAKTGKIDFDLNWIGAPSGEALSEADGHVQIAFDKGQLTTIKPGAGRVVGLTSLAALPRRLALDFSDLTDKGLAFDTVRGDFNLRGGSAFTDDVLVKGPAADIGLIGRVGLKNKDYDQTAVVTGNVGTTLPLAAFAAGPVIGGAVLLFTQVFKQPLRGLARGYYRITGNWDNPMVERIKSAGAPTATVEATK